MKPKNDVIPDSLPSWPNPKVEDVIRHSVSAEIAAYRKREPKDPGPIWLDLPQLQNMVQAGKVRFGSLDLPAPEIDENFVLRAANEAFKDQIVLMFIDENQVTKLDETLDLKPNSRVRYIKLTALRGY